jgi:hypothetical protein
MSCVKSLMAEAPPNTNIETKKAPGVPGLQALIKERDLSLSSGPILS